MNTLLSIPFSILFNIPRLAGLLTSNTFRLDLLGMALEIKPLWAWDPDISPSIPITVSNAQRSPMPRPINDDSRKAVPNAAPDPLFQAAEVA